eukprot:scaffold9882_cov133-Isochrysis_galbana.AAC.1
MSGGLGPLFSLLISPMSQPIEQNMQSIVSHRLSEARLDGPAQLSGEWVLDRSATQGGALREFLLACGAPRIFAGPLARKFDSDHLVIAASAEAVSLATPRNGWSLPIKLQTDATYSRGTETIVATPRGSQRASLSRTDSVNVIEIVKLGPAVGERVTERYTALEGRLEQELHHMSPDGKAEVIVRRVFKRKLSA